MDAIHCDRPPAGGDRLRVGIAHGWHHSIRRPSVNDLGCIRRIYRPDELQAIQAPAIFSGRGDHRKKTKGPIAPIMTTPTMNKALIYGSREFGHVVTRMLQD